MLTRRLFAFKKCLSTDSPAISYICYPILRALDAKNTSKILLKELGVSHFVVVCEECIKGAKRILATLDMRLVAREHVKIRIRVLDQHTHIFERECGKAHLLSELL